MEILDEPRWPSGSKEASRWIAWCVGFCSVGLLILLGISLIRNVLSDIPDSRAGVSTSTVLLTIALVLLAWRRSKDLRKATDARTAAEILARSLAYKDEVTGLFNRRYLKERFNLHNDQGPLTFVLLDMDKFKKVNDLYGHAAGDQLLKVVAGRIQSVVHPRGTCVRLGGDEFGILLEGDQAGIEHTTALASALLDTLSRPVRLDGNVAQVGVSLGLSTLQPGELAEVLLRRSDIAMYAAKRSGGNDWTWFNALMEEQLDQRNAFEAEMRAGILEGRFQPYFQPSLDLASGQITGFEVLARWDHPTRGIVQPDEFIPLAEATGLISDLSLAVMRTALRLTAAH